MSHIPHHYLLTCWGFLVYLMTSEQVGIPDQCISIFLDLSFSKGTGIHSFIKYLFGTYSRADKEYTVFSGGKKILALMELINLVQERENEYPKK